MSLLVERTSVSRISMGTYVGEIPGRRKSALLVRIPKDLGAGIAYIRTTLRPAVRSLFKASTELVFGPIVQICLYAAGY